MCKSLISKKNQTYSVKVGLTDKKALQGFENLCNPFRNPAEEAAKSF
jgi:hypothetical protein